MIREDYEERNKLMTVNKDNSFNFRKYIYLLLFVKVEIFKKLMILILLFSTIRITYYILYRYSINHFNSLNKKIYKDYKVSNLNESIYNNNIFNNKSNKSNKHLFDSNISNNSNLSRTNLSILNYSTEINNNSINMNYNYFIMKEELFWRNESINYNKIQEEILNYKYNHFKISFENKEDFYERENPKISVIITIYNQKEFIKKIYTCIQNQSIKDIEIIFVDDASIDGSNRIIKLLMKKDKRIIYIKNTINKGQYYSRYKGILASKGTYISIIDPDDFLLNDILAKAYSLANYYKLDIVQYYHIKGNITKNNLLKLNISGIFYHNIKEIYYKCSYRYLWDKLILRKIYLKSIHFIKEKYRNSRIIIHNDEVACYAVFRVANSYGVLEQVGYYYNRENEKSITKQNFKPENINGRFYSLFTIMEYYFDQSNNNTFEKTMGGYNFFKLRIDLLYRKKIKYLTKGFIYINNILNLYIKSKFFNKTQRTELKRFKDKVISRYILIFNLTNNNQSCLNNTHIFLY